MTIHRALAELKLIDSRITKGINSIDPTGLSQKDKLVNAIYTKEDFDKNAESRLQSVQSLIERKHLIKSAITKANAETMVKIGGKTMSISDAINFKSVIGFKKGLITQLEKNHNGAKALLEKNNKIIDDNALTIVQQAVGKNREEIDMKNPESVSASKYYLEANTFVLIDPLGVEDLVIKLQEEVDSFEVEVDAVLSEVNALTTIEV